ncbi:hypothetical protein CRUP_001992 [Coryphaenoides rupestris]|nr:hypothetical protein CRUP_001992 [Coryphaenoides rupestris]
MLHTASLNAFEMVADGSRLSLVFPLVSPGVRRGLTACAGEPHDGVLPQLHHHERKREIEELLNNFAQQTGAWRHCLFFLSNTRNEYVMMYSLTVFENLVNKQWMGVASQDKMEIRNCLPKLLLAQHKAMPYFIRNKLCKVIVDIGRQDWPMFYHDFFTNTLQLIQTPGLASLGLVLLKTTSEELACPREDLSVARRDELRKLLLEQVPTVLGLLTGKGCSDRCSVKTV